MIFNYVTTNTLKFQIAHAYFATLGGTHELKQLAIETPETQDESVAEIARHSAVWAARETGNPCVTLDAGFYITALNGFPGPFVKYVNDWLTQEDYLALVDRHDDRSAYFEDATAIGFSDGTSQVFDRKVHGTIARSANPTSTKWPANLLFIPDGYDRPLGSMTAAEQADFWKDGNWPALIEYVDSLN